jgi:uncharacterized membrane protein YciS (DUF1049 family)
MPAIIGEILRAHSAIAYFLVLALAIYSAESVFVDSRWEPSEGWSGPGGGCGHVVSTGLCVAYGVARLFNYDAGAAGGIIAGSLTESSTIGTAGEAISKLNATAQAKESMSSLIAVAFAVTYMIGVIGVTWFLAHVAPRIMGVELAKECREPVGSLLPGLRLFAARASHTRSQASRPRTQGKLLTGLCSNAPPQQSRALL